MQTFREELRYQYPLSPSSIVIDAGGYEGNFARSIAEKYGCHVQVYEPVWAFSERIAARFVGTPMADRIHLHHAGIGATARRETFGVKGDMSGVACTSCNHQEEVSIVPIAGVLLAHAGTDKQVDLLKLNIESMEFEVLEAICDAGLDHRFTNIQVQPHNTIPNAASRWESIKRRLQLNHRITWDEPWIWTNFELR